PESPASSSTPSQAAVPAQAPCPCGSGKPLAACCGPYLAGEAWPETAEALMRSRYTAYALRNYPWLVETTHPAARADVSAEALAAQCKGVRWLRLDVEKCVDAPEPDGADMVEFHALYELDGVVRQIGERSAFVRDEGRLYYMDGTALRPAAYRREAPKVGRNDPCPCGSGKKYKKCCGRTSGDAA
ncbi:MAG: YchJ family protein, partial [Desulfovibrio sp.]|nr:YchJ family protein [Desulfovibrio sp.]